MTKPLGQLSPTDKPEKSERKKSIGLQQRKSLLRKHMAQKYNRERFIR